MSAPVDHSFTREHTASVPGGILWVCRHCTAGFDGRAEAVHHLQRSPHCAVDYVRPPSKVQRLFAGAVTPETAVALQRLDTVLQRH